MDERLITDIGIHAGREALKTMHRVLDTLPTPPDKLAASAIAQGMIEYRMEGLRKLMDSRGVPYSQAVDHAKLVLQQSGQLEKFDESLKKEGF